MKIFPFEKISMKKLKPKYTLNKSRISFKVYFGIFFWALLLINSVPLAFSQQQTSSVLQEKINSLTNQAKSYYAADDLDSAQDTFGVILQFDSEDRTALTYIQKRIPQRRKQIKLIAERNQVKAEREQVRQQRINQIKQEKIEQEQAHAVLQSEREQARKDIALERNKVRQEIQRKKQAKIALKKQEALERQKAVSEAKALKQKINTLYKQGVQAYSQNNLSQASSIFDQLKKIDPENRGVISYLENKIPNRQEKLLIIEQQEQARIMLRLEQEQARAAIALEQDKVKQEAQEKRERVIAERKQTRAALKAEAKQARQERLSEKEAAKKLAEQQKQNRLDKIAQQKAEREQARIASVAERKQAKAAVVNKRAKVREEKKLAKQEKTKVLTESNYVHIQNKKTAEDIFDDAEYFYENKDYQKADTLYAYVEDITNDQLLKKDIKTQRKKIICIFQNQEKQKLVDQRFNQKIEKRKTQAELNAQREKEKQQKRQLILNQRAQAKAERKAAKQAIIAEKTAVRNEKLRKAKAQADLKAQEAAKLKEVQRKAKETQEKIKVLYQQGKAYYAENDFSGAQEMFNRILAIDVNHQSALTYINKHIPAKQKKIKLIEQKRNNKE